MNWRKIRPLILAFLAAFLFICVTGVAVANNEKRYHNFQNGY